MAELFFQRVSMHSCLACGVVNGMRLAGIRMPQLLRWTTSVGAASALLHSALLFCATNILYEVPIAHWLQFWSFISIHARSVLQLGLCTLPTL
jgi:hypothetical protein